MLRRIFGQRQPEWPPTGPITDWPTGDFNGHVSMVVFDSELRNAVDVVGESAYQGTLEIIAGGRTHDGASERDHTALLLPEPTNQYDSWAVRVVVVPYAASTGSGLVGYLSREDAVAYRPLIDRLAAVGRVVACAASLTGGWDRGLGDRGHFGVGLHIARPAAAMRELDSDPSSLRPAWESTP